MAAKKGAKKKVARRVTNIRVGKHKNRRSRAVGVTRNIKKRRRVGATGSRGGLKNIALMAVGVATGAGITHIVLRPLEKRLVDKWPMVGKFIAAGEVFLGGIIALRSKRDFVKSLGVGILAGGVHGLMKQVDIYKNIPGIHGSEDMTEIHIPISGTFQDMVSGLLEDGRRSVRTEIVSGTNHTETVAQTSHVGSEWDDIYEAPIKGY